MHLGENLHTHMYINSFFYEPVVASTTPWQNLYIGLF